MKFRNDFVTNSSSSSFLISDVSSDRLDTIMEEFGLSSDDFCINDEFEGAMIIGDDVISTLCNIILQTKATEYDFLENEDDIEDLESLMFDGDMDIKEKIDSLTELSKSCDVDYDYISEYEEFKEALRICKRILANKKSIMKDITASFEGGYTITDSGRPEFGYVKMSVKDGHGLISEYFTDNDMTLEYLRRWARSHDYYDEDKDDFIGDMYVNPPSEEIAKEIGTNTSF